MQTGQTAKPVHLMERGKFWVCNTSSDHSYHNSNLHCVYTLSLLHLSFQVIQYAFWKQYTSTALTLKYSPSNNAQDVFTCFGGRHWHANFFFPATGQHWRLLQTTSTCTDLSPSTTSPSWLTFLLINALQIPGLPHSQISSHSHTSCIPCSCSFHIPSP